MEDTEMRTCCREEGGKEWERELVGYKGMLRAQKSKGSGGGAIQCCFHTGEKNLKSMLKKAEIIKERGRKEQRVRYI